MVQETSVRHLWRGLWTRSQNRSGDVCERPLERPLDQISSESFRKRLTRSPQNPPGDACERPLEKPLDRISSESFRRRLREVSGEGSGPDLRGHAEDMPRDGKQMANIWHRTLIIFEKKSTGELSHFHKMDVLKMRHICE